MSQVSPKVHIRQTNLLINNAFVPAVSGKRFDTINAASGEVIAQVAEADAADVDVVRCFVLNEDLIKTFMLTYL